MRTYSSTIDFALVRKMSRDHGLNCCRRDTIDDCALSCRCFASTWMRWKLPEKGPPDAPTGTSRAPRMSAVACDVVPLPTLWKWICARYSVPGVTRALTEKVRI